MSSVINAFYNNKILQDNYYKILSNEFRKLWFVSIKRVNGLNLVISAYSKGAHQMKIFTKETHQRLQKEGNSFICLLFLTPSGISVNVLPIKLAKETKTHMAQLEEWKALMTYKSIFQLFPMPYMLIIIWQSTWNIYFFKNPE